MKEIGCIFTMNGTYHLNEKSVYAARLKAMENLPLPENRDYVPDSLIVDDITECMVANGWAEDEVDALSRFTTETLTAEIDRRCKLGIEEDDEGEFTTTRLKEFLLDFYGVEYGASVENGPQSNNQSLSKCFIVICSNSVDEGGACAFDSLTGAWKDVKDDVKNAEKDLVSQGHHPTTIFKSEGATVYVPDSDIYYEWTIIQSTFSKSQKKSPDAPSPAPHHPAEEKVVTEMCPHCMREATIHWDTATMGFKAFCPVCGNPLMLCDECRRSGAPCDYNGEKNCCRLNPSKPASTEVPSALRVETPLGAIIVRADMDEDGVWIDLRRPDADQDMPLVYTSCSPRTKTTEPLITVRVGGEGRKGHVDEEIVMDGIEDYFRTEDVSTTKVGEE